MTHRQANFIDASPAPCFEDVVTPRLDLIPVTAESLLCQRQGGEEMRTKLAVILNAAVPDTWPHENWEPHVYDYLLNLIEKDAEAIGWCRYLALRDDSRYGRTLIGSFGSAFPKPETGAARSATACYLNGSGRASPLKRSRPCCLGCAPAARFATS